MRCPGALLALLACLMGCGGGPSEPSCPGCNVVLVTFDALRADRLGAYGYGKPTSPAIDAFARRSTVFTDCVSQCGTTAGSVPSILTSKFVVVDRLLDGLTLRPDQPTMATVLHAAGYRTLAVISHQYARCAYSGCAGFDVTEDRFPLVESAVTTADRVVRMLDAEAHEPFFLWVHLRQPHAPYDADAAEFATMYDAAPDALTYFSPTMRGVGFFEATDALVRHYRNAGEPVLPMGLVDGGARETTPTVLRQLQALYDTNVRAGDGAFGRIVDHLERRGVSGRTIVVVGADHGEALGEHEWFGHNRLWQGILNTPLIVHVPGVPHRTMDEPVMNVDIFPTVARLVGVPLATPVRGRDLFGPRSRDDLQYAEYSNTYVLIQGRSKIHVAVPRVPQVPAGASVAAPAAGPPPRVKGLWDLASDPGEVNDLASARADLAARLTIVAEELRRQSLSSRTATPTVDMRERLRELGYIAPDAAKDE